MTVFVPQTAASGKVAPRNKDKKKSRVFPCTVFKPSDEGELVITAVLAARQPKRVIALGNI